MNERRKRGRPAGSGKKPHFILGCRVSKGEYDFIKESLNVLKKKYKKKNKILLALFENLE
ncbi:hypothetical protein [Fusobacterium sp.]|uniref:hypothetical protein n=1 Tax=Fusobacterium sp. TaxID=68766 RepID=UPI0029037408|nr:hypothetical protein [Fusobacterium sp.]MDU1910379.1 hypothetical protein [Fusobacterium sp.]